MNHLRPKFCFIFLKKLVYFLILYCGISSCAIAQEYPHTSLWTRFQVTAPVSKQWQVVTAVHWRRQNNYLNNTVNFLEEPLLTGAHAQLVRRNKKQTVAFIPIQINYFLANTLLGREEDFSVPQNREWRYSVGFELTQNNKSRWTFRERVLQEFRFFRSNQDQPVGRVRTRFQINYKWKSFVSINGLTEVILHTPPQINNLPAVRFHQFWLGSSLLWQLPPHLNLETGYTFIRTQRLNKTEADNQNVTNLHLFVRL
ncbi:MAG: DUF2490 domain-containing protein [Runella slithyformis]|nr:MAG: DUF2490 domain-containing protein [Runella slithyformis]